MKKRRSHDIQLLINDYKLDQVKETIFLGVILDENLNWKSGNLTGGKQGLKVYRNNSQI